VGSRCTQHGAEAAGRQAGAAAGAGAGSARGTRSEPRPVPRSCPTLGRNFHPLCLPAALTGPWGRFIDPQPHLPVEPSHWRAAGGQLPASRIWADERQGETAAVVKGQKGLPARSLPSGPCTGRDPRVCLCLVYALLNRIVPLSRMRFLMRRRRRGRRSRARAGLRRVSGLGV
jgi:hypothetical protein